MRCNCQMSFSSSFERPRFKLRSHRKRMNNTTRIGRPMASVARTMVKNSASRAVRDWVIGSLQMQASGGRIQQRGSDDKRIAISGQAVKRQLGGKFISTLLSNGARSEFPTGFHAALLLGHSPCQEENQVPVFLIHLGK